MKNVLLVIFVAMVGAVACQPAAKNTPAQQTPNATTPFIKNVKVAEFKNLMNQPDVVVLDVRTAGEVAQGAIDGAIHIDVLSPDFDAKVNGLDKSKTYLVYCKAGGRSSNACTKMNTKGFGKLYNLEGGFTAWERQ